MEKQRGQKGGMKYLWKEFGSYEIDKNEPVYFGYTSDKEIVEQFMEKTVAEYGLKKIRDLSGWRHYRDTCGSWMHCN